MNLNCLISKEPIQENITLPCNHSYDYIYLYEEIKVQKQRHKAYFKCPYCRHQYYATIPYYEIEDVEKLTNINNNHRNMLNIHKCSHINCVKAANKYKTGLYCNKHVQTSNTTHCSAICKNGNGCKNAMKMGTLCNVHYKKENKNIIVNNNNG
jgi:hypothetical protein